MEKLVLKGIWGARHPKVHTSYEGSEEKFRTPEENELLKVPMKGNWGDSQPKSFPAKGNTTPLISHQPWNLSPLSTWLFDLPECPYSLEILLSGSSYRDTPAVQSLKQMAHLPNVGYDHLFF